MAICQNLGIPDGLPAGIFKQNAIIVDGWRMVFSPVSGKFSIFLSPDLSILRNFLFINQRVGGGAGIRKGFGSISFALSQQCDGVYKRTPANGSWMA